MRLSEIKRPGFIIDKKKVLENINSMKAKADRCNVIFRPHFKTHQSAAIAEIYRAAGVDKITVSSVQMAEFFAALGWNDITIAFPFNIREFNEILDLSKKVNLNLLISNRLQISHLIKNQTCPINYFIKIDTGYHRSGIEPSEIADIDEIIDSASANKLLKFSGFLAHFGHTYKTIAYDEIHNIFKQGVSALNGLKSRYMAHFEDINISIGDTPSCSIIDDLSEVDEIRPGNFVYYDAMQLSIGSCNKENIAVAVACPVIDKKESRNEMLIYGGAVHLSKEFIVNDSGERNFGHIVLFTENGWDFASDGSFVKSISQEHGILHAGKDIIKRIECGDLLGVIPVHSCLTANLLKGDQLIIG